MRRISPVLKAVVQKSHAEGRRMCFGGTFGGAATFWNAETILVYRHTGRRFGPQKGALPLDVPFQGKFANVRTGV